jgi:ubiquinone/menaquinone biosynthesis C-methylase UbiE
MVFAGGALLQQHPAFDVTDKDGERAVLQSAPVGFQLGSEADCLSVSSTRTSVSPSLPSRMRTFAMAKNLAAKGDAVESDAVLCWAQSGEGRMASATKSLVQSQFGANAERYAVSRVHAEGESLSRLLEAVQPRADWEAIDIATGPGHTALAFAPKVKHVIAADVTPEMLQVASGLAAKRGVTNVSFAEMLAEKLPFPDASFDLVTCRTAPHHFADVPAFVTEVARVLRPGGVFGLVDNISPDDPEAAALHNEFEKLRDPSHGRCLSEKEWLSLMAGLGSWCATAKSSPRTSSSRVGGPHAGFAGSHGKAGAILRGASGGLRDFLQPQERADNIDFVLMESLMVAEKPR